MITETVTVKIEGVLAEWLAKDQRSDLIAAGKVTVDKDQFDQLIAHCRTRHPDFTQEHLEAWAVLYLTGKSRSWQEATKKASNFDLQQTADWAWRVIVVLLLLAELLK